MKGRGIRSPSPHCSPHRRQMVLKPYHSCAMTNMKRDFLQVGQSILRILTRSYRGTLRCMSPKVFGPEEADLGQ